MPDADHFIAQLATDDTKWVKRGIESHIEKQLHGAVGDLYRRFGEPPRLDTGEIGIEHPAGQEWKGYIARFIEHLIDDGVMAPPLPSVPPARGSLHEFNLRMLTGYATSGS